jgi:LPXTG-motif cell wall-anchored protein
MSRADSRLRALRARLWVGLGCLVPALYASPAGAYCQTTTCDPDKDSCTKDSNGCPTSGSPLYWPDQGVTFAVDSEGSKALGITYEEAEKAVERSFQAWISAECKVDAGPLGVVTRHPSIGVVPLGVSYCKNVEYNYPKKNDERVRAPNANIIVFRDGPKESWTHSDEDSTLALTILDADIEVNSTDGHELSTSDTEVTDDLQSILTHEVGHFLGLAHSQAKGASMNPEYRVHLGDTTFRTLSPDDQAAICSIYKPQEADITDCTGEGPRFGFSRTCGVQKQADASWLCAYSPHAGSNSASLFGLAGSLGVLGASLLRRRRR